MKCDNCSAVYHDRVCLSQDVVRHKEICGQIKQINQGFDDFSHLVALLKTTSDLGQMHSLNLILKKFEEEGKKVMEKAALKVQLMQKMRTQKG